MFDHDAEKCLNFVSNLTKLEKKHCEYYGGRDGSGELFNLNNGFNRIVLNHTYFVPKHSLVYIEQYYDGLTVLLGQHKRVLKRSDIYVVYDYSGLNMTKLKTVNNFNWKINIEPQVTPLIDYLSRKSTSTTSTAVAYTRAPYETARTSNSWETRWQTRWFNPDWTSPLTTTTRTTSTTTPRTTTSTTTRPSSTAGHRGQELEIHPKYKRTQPGKYVLLNSELMEDSLVSGFEVYMIEPGVIEIGVSRLEKS